MISCTQNNYIPWSTDSNPRCHMSYELSKHYDYNIACKTKLLEALHKAILQSI